MRLRLRATFAPMPPSGYSGTPLAKKLGLKPGFAIKLIDAPQDYRALFDDWPEGLSEPADAIPKDFIHLFATRLASLRDKLPSSRSEMKPDAALWVSWPKKAAKVAADIGENDIRALALQNGLVDVKVCAIDATWSGLKLVIPLKLRAAHAKALSSS